MASTNADVTRISIADIQDKLPRGGGELAAVLDNIEKAFESNDASNKAIAATLARHIQANILENKSPTNLADIQSLLKLQHLIAVSEPLELGASTSGTIAAAQQFSKSVYKQTTAAIAGVKQLASSYQKDPAGTINEASKSINHFVNSINASNIIDSINQWGEEDNARKAVILRMDDASERAFANSEREARIHLNGLVAAYGISRTAKLGGNIIRKVANKFDDIPFDGELVADGIGTISINATRDTAVKSHVALPISLNVLGMKTSVIESSGLEDDMEESELNDDEFENEYPNSNLSRLESLDEASEARILSRRDEIKKLVVDGEFNLTSNELERIGYDNVFKKAKTAEAYNVNQHLQYKLSGALNPDPSVLPNKQAISALIESLDTRSDHYTKDTKKLFKLLLEEINDYKDLSSGRIPGEPIHKNYHFGSDRNRLFRGGFISEFEAYIDPEPN